MTGVGGSARQVRAVLAEAPDAAVGRVVAMLDGLVERGEADAVLEGVRPRLRRLRPPRPLRFGRVLLMPLEGALVAPSAWRGSPSEIPRSAIGPLVAGASAALGPLAEEIEAAALGHSTADAALIGRLGARLWPAAGAVTLPTPLPGWAEAGLPQAATAPVVVLCGALWRHGRALWQAREAAADGPPEPILRAALAPLAAEGSAPLVAGMALLLREAARPGLVIAVATGLHATIARAAEREVEALLARDAAAIAGSTDPAEAASAAAILGMHLADLEASATGAHAGRRGQLAAHRHAAAGACGMRFVEALAERLLAPAAAACAGPPASDVTVAALEAAAAGLRQLEAATRRLGAAAGLDRARHDAVARLIALGATPGGLTRTELARLVEILAGTEAALPLLG